MERAFEIVSRILLLVDNRLQTKKQHNLKLAFKYRSEIIFTLKILFCLVETKKKTIICIIGNKRKYIVFGKN